MHLCFTCCIINWAIAAPILTQLIKIPLTPWEHFPSSKAYLVIGKGCSKIFDNKARVGQTFCSKIPLDVPSTWSCRVFVHLFEFVFDFNYVSVFTNFVVLIFFNWPNHGRFLFLLSFYSLCILNKIVNKCC